MQNEHDVQLLAQGVKIRGLVTTVILQTRSPVSELLQWRKGSAATLEALSRIYSYSCRVISWMKEDKVSVFMLAWRYLAYLLRK